MSVDIPTIYPDEERLLGIWAEHGIPADSSTLEYATNLMLKLHACSQAYAALYLAELEKPTLQDRHLIADHGLVIESHGDGFVLLDPEGHNLQIGNHGGVSPTRWEAEHEAVRRIRRGDYP